MYFVESESLTKRHVSNRAILVQLDREFAHSYDPAGTGYVDASTIALHTGLDPFDIGIWAKTYEARGVVKVFQRLECPDCGHLNSPINTHCIQCGRALSTARHAGQLCYMILKQPAMPSYDPYTQSDSPDVFISYKHSDAAALAADIFYQLRADGKQVFLDNGSIPPGTHAESVFLRAVSRASHFICLVSADYFTSTYCRKEIAHAARCLARVLRVNVPPIPTAPCDMPWVDTPNWLPVLGNGSGLTRDLDAAIQRGLQATGPVADMRSDACAFLLEQLSMGDITTIRNRLAYMRETRQPDAKPEVIEQIMRETTPDRLDLLCAVLSP